MSEIMTVEQKDDMKSQVNLALSSGLLPSTIKTAAMAMTIALKGRELDLGPMAALSYINVIQGKPALSAEGMRYLIVRKHGPDAFEVLKTDSKECVIKAKHHKAEFRFTIEDAELAGLMGNSTWKKYPRQMLQARATSEMARLAYPDCLGGVSYLPDEIESINTKPVTIKTDIIEAEDLTAELLE